MFNQKVKSAFGIVILLLSIAHLSKADDKNPSCYKCISTNDLNCINDVSKVTTTVECQNENTCFTSLDGGVLTRGCKPKSECTENCLTCTGDLCNTNIFCKKCNSETDAECVQPTTSAIKSEICSKGVSKCMVLVNEKKYVERRCATADDEKCDNQNKATPCETCAKADCNKEVFPTDRRSCYQCNGCSDAVKSTDSKPAICKLYDPNDKCYTFGTSETTLVRGCLSDVDTQAVQCSKTDSDEKCLKCDANDCNKISYMRSPMLKCIQCVDTDINCVWGQSAGNAKTCTKPIEYWKTEKCYTEKLSNDKGTRGCLFDRDADAKPCTNENNCSTCDKDGCNIENVISYTCIRCRSDAHGQGECSKEASGIAGSACRSPVSVADKGCFTDRRSNGIVIRGCLVDYDATNKANCLDPKYKSCDSCSNATDCNNKQAPSSAAAIHVTIGLMVAAMAVFCVLCFLEPNILYDFLNVIS